MRCETNGRTMPSGPEKRRREIERDEQPQTLRLEHARPRFEPRVSRADERQLAEEGRARDAERDGEWCARVGRRLDRIESELAGLEVELRERPGHGKRETYRALREIRRSLGLLRSGSIMGLQIGEKTPPSPHKAANS